MKEQNQLKEDQKKWTMYVKYEHHCKGSEYRGFSYFNQFAKKNK